MGTLYAISMLDLEVAWEVLTVATPELDDPEAEAELETPPWQASVLWT